ncbi:MAG TPA: hypothetical protein VH170_06180 [Chthoniobacterales bacterium]|jgi:hypothetical protein|nr:hypothetical protein [Chthoniobacterales bacterium]
MRVIKITRPKSRHRSVRKFTRDFFATEHHLEFAIEAAIFGALLAISAWPILAAADAINRFM